MAAYYNEIDQKMAAWLRKLIKAGAIAPGEVDERDIRDVRASELSGFEQHHFFAGIGGWSLALRQAGWADDRHIWTGSCPCQSFSAAGQGKGFADERHLWPAWFHLIGECQPATIFGEQVDAAIRHGWLDLVHADLEALGYAVGSAVIPAAGVGAPHGRHRLWFVANAQNADRRSRSGFTQEGIGTDRERRIGFTSGSEISGMEHTDVPNEHERQPSSGQQSIHEVGDGQSGTVVNSENEQAWISRFARERRTTAGFWTDVDWIPCRDGKWRPIEPLSFSMVDGLSERLGQAWNESVREIETGVIAYAEKTHTSAGEVMREVRAAIREGTLREDTGGPESILEASLLLAALCEFEGELGSIEHSAASGCGSLQEGGVRIVRPHEPCDQGPACSPPGRQHAQQLALQLADIVRKLPQEIAPRMIGNFPLWRDVPNRMGLLRGFGNAIVPTTAQAFIEAYMSL